MTVAVRAHWDVPGVDRRLVALTFIKPAIAANEVFLKRLREESQLTQRLNHVNIAHTFDMCERDGIIWHVMEYIEGITLQQVLDTEVSESEPASPEVAAFIASEICAGLSYAHARRDERGRPLDIVHGDIRPRHVLLSAAGAIKVVDFGVCRARRKTGAASVDTEAKDASLYHYTARECARGAWASTSSDIFSVAALAYHLLTGRPPHAGDTTKEVLANARTAEVAPISDLNPDVPAELEDIFARALNSDPAERYPTAQAFRAALSTWLRRNFPGFGRHRLKSYFGSRLAPRQRNPGYRPLSRKDFRPVDAASTLHTPTETIDHNPGLPIGAMIFGVTDGHQIVIDENEVGDIIDEEIALDDTLELDTSDQGDLPAEGTAPTAPNSFAQIVAPDDNSAGARRNTRGYSGGTIQTSRVEVSDGDLFPDREDVQSGTFEYQPDEELGEVADAHATSDESHDVSAAAGTDAAPSAGHDMDLPSSSTDPGVIDVEHTTTATRPPAATMALSPDSVADAVKSAGDSEPKPAAGSAGFSAAAVRERAEPAGGARARSSRTESSRRGGDADPGSEAGSSRPQLHSEDLTPVDFATEVYDDSTPVEGVPAARAAQFDYLTADDIETPRRGAGGRIFAVILTLALLAGAAYAVNEFVLNAEEEPVAAAPASVFVTSRPQGAEIIVNGTATGVHTPTTYTPEQSEGAVEVTIRLDGYTEPGSQTVSLEEGSQAEVRFELQPLPHSISVESIPPGATVLVDNEPAGTTPTQVGPLEVDYFRGVDVILRRPGYIDEFAHIEWQAGEPSSTLSRTLRPDPSPAATAIREAEAEAAAEEE